MLISHLQKYAKRVFPVRDQLSPLMGFKDLGSFPPLRPWHCLHPAVHEGEKAGRRRTQCLLFWLRSDPSSFPLYSLLKTSQWPRSSRGWEIQFLGKKVLLSHTYPLGNHLAKCRNTYENIS